MLAQPFCGFHQSIPHSGSSAIIVAETNNMPCLIVQQTLILYGCKNKSALQHGYCICSLKQTCMHSVLKSKPYMSRLDNKTSTWIKTLTFSIKYKVVQPVSKKHITLKSIIMIIPSHTSSSNSSLRSRNSSRSLQSSSACKCCLIWHSSCTRQSWYTSIWKSKILELLLLLLILLVALMVLLLLLDLLYQLIPLIHQWLSTQLVLDVQMHQQAQLTSFSSCTCSSSSPCCSCSTTSINAAQQTWK